MRQGGRVLANLFKLKRISSGGVRIIPRHLRATSSESGRKHEDNGSSQAKFIVEQSLARRGLLVLSVAGLAGFVAFLKNKFFLRAECDVDPKEIPKGENIQTRDNYIADACFKEAIKKSKAILERVKRENNCPAITVTVSVDGRQVWSEGIGLVDIENDIKCTKKSVFRIASISKSITMAVVGKLIEDGLLDIDLPVKHYVPEWPDKYFKGADATITTRHLVSMMSGIRNYDKELPKSVNDKNKAKKRRRGDYEFEEFHINRPLTLSESLDLFKNDELCSMPGTEYLYSTHNWTLLSAVVESVTRKKIEDVFHDLFQELNLQDTRLDLNSAVVPNRARYYNASHTGKLQNAPPVNNSYKWAGGGLQATSSDVCKFGTLMLAFHQGINNQSREFRAKSSSSSAADKVLKKPYLSQSTMKMLWTPVENTRCAWDRDGFYAMGWCSVPTRATLLPRIEPETPIDNRRRQYFSHTGGAMGASSVLLIMPRDETDQCQTEDYTDGCIDGEGQNRLPKGTVVAIITNMQQVQLNPSALEIAAIFETARDYKNRHDFFQYFMDEDKNLDPELLLSLFYVHQ